MQLIHKRAFPLSELGLPNDVIISIKAMKIMGAPYTIIVVARISSSRVGKIIINGKITRDAHFPRNVNIMKVAIPHPIGARVTKAPIKGVIFSGDMV